MKFSNKQDYSLLDEVYVIRTEKEMQSRDEYNSNLWEYVKMINPKKGLILYKTVVRDVKVSETIHDRNGRNLGYRVE